jgi:hypothetical protein
MTQPTDPSESVTRNVERLKDELEENDSTAFRQAVNEIYSKQGLTELRNTLTELKKQENPNGLKVDVKENGKGLPDIHIDGTIAETKQKVDIDFEATKDGRMAKVDDKGRISEMRLPSGWEFKFQYSDLGGGNSAIEKVTTAAADGKLEDFTYRPVEMEDENGNTKRRMAWASDSGTVLNFDVSLGRSGGESSSINLKYSDGTSVAYEVNKKDEWTVSTTGENFNKTIEGSAEKTYLFAKDHNLTQQLVRPLDSPVARINDLKSSKEIGYQFTNRNGHTESLESLPDGKLRLTRGAKVDEFPQGSKWTCDDQGNRKIVQPDGSTFEGKSDGSTIARDKAGRITEMTNLDGTTTNIIRNAGNDVMVMMSDDSGRPFRVHNSWADGHPDPLVMGRVKLRDVSVNDKDGSMVIKFSNGDQLKRAFDGTEQLFNDKGIAVDTSADKFLKQIKDSKVPLTPQQEKQLDADMTIIEKMGWEQKEKIYASLEKIATANTDATTKLTPEERSEIIRSLADQVAHPGNIKQGGKETCVVASAEQLIAHNDPVLYADMISKLALEGKFQAPGGSREVVAVQRDKGGGLAEKTDPYHQRSLTSELFQNAAANLALPDGVEYRSYNPNSDRGRTLAGDLPVGTYPSTDSGSRVVKENKSAKEGEVEIRKDANSGAESIDDFTGLTPDDRVRVLNALLPVDQHFKSEPITSAEMLEKAYDTNGSGALSVSLAVGVDAQFLGMSQGAATRTGLHAVNITKMQRDSAGKLMVYYHNTAGGADHSYPNGTPVAAEEFVKAMSGMRAVISRKRN